MQSLPIMLYHQVSDIAPSQDPYGLATSPGQFSAQMAYLHEHGFYCLRLADAVRQLVAGQPLPDKAFAITFDDGYRDNYEVALPILQGHGFTATIFLVADRIGADTNWEGQRDASAFPLLSWDEIKAMRAAGIDFGSHTRSHAHLDQLGDAQARYEIGTSKDVLEEGLGEAIELLAYPYERFTAETLQIVEDCGYLGACGTSRLPESRFNLWRVEFGAQDTLNSLQYKLSWRWRATAQVKRQLRPLRDLLRG